MSKRAAKTIKGLSDLAPDRLNPNLGTERGSAMLNWSVTELGMGRSILADRNGNIIAGNKTLDAISEHGFPIRVVQTDGKEAVVVQRTDLDLYSDDDKRGRQLSIVDNESQLVGYRRDAEVLLTHQASGVDLSPMFRADEIGLLVEAVKRESRLDYKLLADDASVSSNDAAALIPQEKFPLAIVLDRPTLNRWQEYKAAIDATSDSAAFLMLLNDANND